MATRSYKAPGEDEKRALEIVERVFSNLCDMGEDIWRALMLLDYNPALGGETNEHLRLENARGHLSQASQELAGSAPRESVITALERRIKNAEAEEQQGVGHGS